MSEDRKKKNLFIQEQIRRKPFYKKKGFQKTIHCVGMAAVFGASAGLVFAAVHFWALNYFGKPDTMVVVGEETKASETTDTSETEKVAVVEKKELNLKDYEKLYDEMTKVTEKVSNALVTVTGFTEELDLFNDVDAGSKATGVVISQQDQEMLVLTESGTIREAEAVKVTFHDGTIMDARLQAADEIMDLAVLKIDTGKMEESTLNKVKPVTFGASATVEIGDPIIALGVDCISFGMVTSRPYLELCDGSYRQISTDIIGKVENGGVLLNLKGQVVGILGPDSKSSHSLTTLNGVGISEIGNLINGLANKQVFPYFGIVGKEVTDALAKELSMPKGVFVTRVEENSPAMEKGIQATDVISELNGQKVKNMKDYMAILRSMKPGDTISVNLWRKGINEYKETKVEITLSER